MKVVVSGATGTIGSALVKELAARGDEVTALSRDAGAARETLGVDAARWADPQSEAAPVDALRGADAVVHLLGEPVAQRWSDEREARDPRVPGAGHAQPRGRAARAAGERAPAHARLPVRHRLLRHRGATSGWTRRRRGAGDFLAEVTEAWETEARTAEELGLRVVDDPDRGGAVRLRRGAREDAAAVQARRGRARGRRAPVRALGARGRRGGRAGVRARHAARRRAR